MFKNKEEDILVFLRFKLKAKLRQLSFEFFQVEDKGKLESDRKIVRVLEIDDFDSEWKRKEEEKKRREEREEEKRKESWRL